MRALVVESGHARSALAGVRGLGVAGWTVGVAAPVRGLASSSRWCSRWHRLSALGDGASGFAAALERIIADFGYEVVLPAGDAELLTLSAVRDQISARVPLPPHDALVAGVDKLHLMRAAAAHGIDVPATWDPQEPRPAGAAGPVVVKPRLHSGPGAPVARRRSAVADQPEDVRRAIARIEASGGSAVLQEHVHGRLMAWVGVIDDTGRLVAVLQQEAARTHPPGAGVTARGVTVTVTPDLTRRVMQLLSALSWSGLAQLQFILPDDERPRLIDLNARFYGSMALAVGAGVNFPALLAALGTGRPVEPAEAPPGIRFQWFEGDLRSAASERRGRLVRDLGDVLRWSLGAHHSVWRVRDPRPAVTYVRQLGRRAAGLATGQGQSRQVGA